VGAAESVGKSTATDGPRQYTVERGDTLSYLALRHYGDPFKWEKIYEANKETMNNPHYMLDSGLSSPPDHRLGVLHLFLLMIKYCPDQTNETGTRDLVVSRVLFLVQLALPT